MNQRRELFDIPRDLCWLNAAYLGPLPNRTTEIGLAAVRRKANPWSITPVDFHTDVDRVKALYAQLIGAKPQEIAITPSTSYGIATIAANITLPAGKTVVVPAQEHTSAYHAWVRSARKSGANVRITARGANQSWGEAIIGAIDVDTAVVSVPACHWSDGRRFDLPAIAEKARSVGALLVIDGTQSIGAWEFDVKTIDPDFVICSCYKWLLGPYTLAFLYAAPRWHGMEPLELSPFNRVGVREAEGNLEPLEELIPDAARFDMGERSNFITLPMMVASLETLLSIGVPAIQANSDRINQAIADGAARLGFHAPADRAPHLMGLRNPAAVGHAQNQILKQRKIYVSVRGDAYRISPHIYNDQGDVDLLLHGLAALKAQAA